MATTTKPHFQAQEDEIEYTPDGDSTLKPRGLSIVWGNDARYWKLPKKTNSSEPNAPLELIQVSWLEVTGSVPVAAGKRYQISFDVELAPDAFGWRDIQAFLMAKVGKKGKYKWTRVRLAQGSNTGKFTIPDTSGSGQPFTVEVPPNHNTEDKLHFGLYEVWSGKWKGGLKIYRACVKAVS